jgi:hypothetical protein
MSKHKNQPDSIPAHRLAFHPQRGVRVMAGELKPGWRWCAPHEDARTLKPKPLVKFRVRRGPVGWTKR